MLRKAISFLGIGLAGVCAAQHIDDEVQLRVRGSSEHYSPILRILHTKDANEGLDEFDRTLSAPTNAVEGFEVKSYIFDEFGDITLEVDARNSLSRKTLIEGVDLVSVMEPTNSVSPQLESIFGLGPHRTCIIRGSLYDSNGTFTGEFIYNPNALEPDRFGRIRYDLPLLEGYPKGSTFGTLSIRRDLITTNECAITSFTNNGDSTFLTIKGPIGSFATPVLYDTLGENVQTQVLSNLTRELPATLTNFYDGVTSHTWTNVPTVGSEGYYRVRYSPTR